MRGDVNSQNNYSNDGFFRRILGYIEALLSGAQVFVCAYWFFHFETWLERCISIGLTLLAAWLVVKCLPAKYR